LQKVAFLREVEMLKIDQNALCIMKRKKIFQILFCNCTSPIWV